MKSQIYALIVLIIIFMIVEGCFKGTSPLKSEHYYIKCARDCAESVNISQCHEICMKE